VKTIEALALGKPFVGTSKAFRGMPIEQVRNAGLRMPDDPAAFAEAIVSTLAEEDSEGSTSLAAYDRIFSRQATFASRDDAVRMSGQSGIPIAGAERG